MPGCSIGLLFQGWSREVPLRLRLYHMPSRELPPLARGLPSPSCSASAGGGDHPRSRGVYGASSLLQLLIGGSSPLARGLLRGPVRGILQRWIIPARAGFTRIFDGLIRDGMDHPRSRGVCPASVIGRDSKGGSSPLARGLRHHLHPLRVQGGIIPARAGFTIMPVNADNVLGGSSPLARGLHREWLLQDSDTGIIPARAGFTRAPTPPTR